MLPDAVARDAYPSKTAKGEAAEGRPALHIGCFLRSAISALGMAAFRRSALTFSSRWGYFRRAMRNCNDTPVGPIVGQAHAASVA
jgi:hypothetical protein